MLYLISLQLHSGNKEVKTRTLEADFHPFRMIFCRKIIVPGILLYALHTSKVLQKSEFSGWLTFFVRRTAVEYIVVELKILPLICVCSYFNEEDLNPSTVTLFIKKDQNYKIQLFVKLLLVSFVPLFIRIYITFYWFYQSRSVKHKEFQKLKLPRI